MNKSNGRGGALIVRRCVITATLALAVFAIFKASKHITYAASIHERVALSIIRAVSIPGTRAALDKWLNDKVPNYMFNKSPRGQLDFYDFDYSILGIGMPPGRGIPVTFEYTAGGDFQCVYIPWGRSGLIVTLDPALQILSREFTVWKCDEYYVYYHADRALVEDLKVLAKAVGTSPKGQAE